MHVCIYTDTDTHIHTPPYTNISDKRKDHFYNIFVYTHKNHSENFPGIRRILQLREVFFSLNAVIIICSLYQDLDLDLAIHNN